MPVGEARYLELAISEDNALEIVSWAGWAMERGIFVPLPLVEMATMFHEEFKGGDDGGSG